MLIYFVDQLLKDAPTEVTLASCTFCCRGVIVVFVAVVFLVVVLVVAQQVKQMASSRFCWACVCKQGLSEGEAFAVRFFFVVLKDLFQIFPAFFHHDLQDLFSASKKNFMSVDLDYPFFVL